MTTKPTMLTYIEKEQEAFLQILQNYPSQQDEALEEYPTTSKHWLILATGSSYNAALSAKNYVEKMAGIRISIEQPFQYQHYEQVDPTIDFLVGVSQSGQSTATIDALDFVRRHHAVPSLAVTSIPGTEVTQATDSTLDIQIGREQVGYVSLGFSATVLGLMLIGLRVARKKGLITTNQEQAELEDFSAILANTNRLIDQTTDFAQQYHDDFTAARQFATIAYGPAVGTAKEMETKFTEIVRLPSNGYELESYMHGPYLALNSESRLFFIRTNGEQEILDKAQALENYERRFTSHVFTIDFTSEKDFIDGHVLHAGNVKDETKVPVIAATVFQVLAWYIAIDQGINLSDLIFEDFSDAVHNKTERQNYV